MSIQKLQSLLAKAGIPARVDAGFKAVLYWPNKAKQVFRCIDNDGSLIVTRKGGWSKVMSVDEASREIIRETKK